MNEFLVNSGMMFVVAIAKGDDWGNWNGHKGWISENGYADEVMESMRDWAKNEFYTFSQMALMSLLLTVANGKFCLLAFSA